MYPITADTMSFQDIAVHWSRAMPEKPTPAETLDVLLRAFWRGAFEGASRSNGRPLTRRQALKAILSDTTHPGLKQITQREYAANPNGVYVGIDGEPIYEVAVCVVVPDDGQPWTPSLVKGAYEAISHASYRSGDFSEGAMTGLRLLELRFADFQAWRAAEDFAETGFWRPRDAASPSALRELELRQLQLENQRLGEHRRGQLSAIASGRARESSDVAKRFWAPIVERAVQKINNGKTKLTNSRAAELVVDELKRQPGGLPINPNTGKTITARTLRGYLRSRGS